MSSAVIEVVSVISVRRGRGHPRCPLGHQQRSQSSQGSIVINIIIGGHRVVSDHIAKNTKCFWPLAKVGVQLPQFEGYVLSQLAK